MMTMKMKTALMVLMKKNAISTGEAPYSVPHLPNGSSSPPYF
jgi:hypothetical protein